MLQLIGMLAMFSGGLFFGWKLHERHISKIVVKNLMNVLEKKSIIPGSNVIQLVHRKKETSKG